jgi:putative SOS response-associated peptidase YedK
VCARFTLFTPPDELERLLGVAMPEDLAPRYNVAPTQDVLAVLHEGERRARMLRWGLFPTWAEDPSIGQRLINARSESAAEKPAFREAFRKRRCVIPASGFYEWCDEAEPEAQMDLFGDPVPSSKTFKQPYLFARSDGRPMLFAGLWERRDRLETCAILTGPANGAVRPYHDRMPCVLEPDEIELWLDAGEAPERLGPLLEPLPDDAVIPRRVSREVSNPRVEHAGLIAPTG